MLGLQCQQLRLSLLRGCAARVLLLLFSLTLALYSKTSMGESVYAHELTTGFIVFSPHSQPANQPLAANPQTGTQYHFPEVVDWINRVVMFPDSPLGFAGVELYGYEWCSTTTYACIQILDAQKISNGCCGCASEWRRRGQILTQTHVGFVHTDLGIVRF